MIRQNHGFYFVLKITNIYKKNQKATFLRKINIDIQRFFFIFTL